MEAETYKTVNNVTNEKKQKERKEREKRNQRHQRQASAFNNSAILARHRGFMNLLYSLKLGWHALLRS